ncbi:MAG: hypothetical protein N2C12_06560, partial [Planctomycetales bacterium]
MTKLLSIVAVSLLLTTGCRAPGNSHQAGPVETMAIRPPAKDESVQTKETPLHQATVQPTAHIRNSADDAAEPVPLPTA